jgi:hypothetical protein
MLTSVMSSDCNCCRLILCRRSARPVRLRRSFCSCGILIFRRVLKLLLKYYQTTTLKRSMIISDISYRIPFTPAAEGPTHFPQRIGNGMKLSSKPLLLLWKSGKWRNQSSLSPFSYRLQQRLSHHPRPPGMHCRARVPTYAGNERPPIITVCEDSW